MPFQTIKDPETGEERRVYVAPKPAAEPAAKPQAQAQAKPQPGPSFLGGASPAQVLYDVVGSTPLGAIAQPSRAIGEGIVRGAQELAKTGDIVKAAQAGVAKAQQAPAPLPQRAMQSALRNTLQELSDVGTDIAGAAFGGGGTTAKQPDKPFLGVLPALPKQPVKLGMLEEVTTGLLQLGVQMSGLGFAQAGLTATALASKTPAIAKAGQALQKAEKGVQALQKAPVLGGGLTQATKGLAQRGLGYYVEGAGKGAIVDFAGFDQHAENISSMVDSAVDSLAGTDLQLPVVEYLRSKPGDEGAFARLRNAVDGFAWGGPAGMALGAGAAGIKGTSKLLTKTLEFVKAAKDEADLIKTAQRAATQPAAAVVEEPARAEVVDAADMQARMQDAEQQVRRAQTQLEQLGPEPERPEVKEKGPRATAYRSWTRKANALQKQLTEAQSVLSSLTMESGVTRAPEFNRVTGRADLRIPEERPAQAPQVVTPAPSLEEVAAKRETAQQELKQAWEEARTQMDQPEVEVLPPAAGRTPLSAQFREKLQNLGGSLADVTRTMEGVMQRQEESLARRATALEQEMAAMGMPPTAQPAAQALPPAAAEPTAKVKFTPTQRAEIENFNTTLMQEMGIDLNAPLSRTQLETLESSIRRDFAPPDEGGVETVTTATRRSMIKLADKMRKTIDSMEPAPAVPVAAAAGPTPERIAQIDEALAMGRADLSPEERIALRDQLLAQEAAGGGAGAPPPTEPPVAQMGPLPDPDLEAVVNAAAAKLEDLKAGRVTLEDLMRNEVRRFVSPSGQTIYNSRASEELMAFVQSISDNVIDPLTKAKVTGQPSLDMNDLHRQAARQMRADGFTPEAINQMVGRAQEYVDVNSDVAAKVRFVRSMQLAIDHLGNETAILALRWKNRNIADVGERGDLAKQLVAAYDELSRVYVPYMALGRQAAQEMRGRQMKNAFDGGLLAVPQGTVLRHGTDSAAAQAILEGGFKQGSKGGNLLGAGVYFTTSKTHAAAYGNTEVYGDIPADTLILDLIEGGRSVNDVAKEIGLGPIKSTLVDGEPIQYMTSQQKDAFRAWVLDQGYDGVRYDATFSATGVKGRTGADEVVIYDVNKANRIVGSKAAVQPPEPPRTNAVEIVAKEMQADVENLLEKLDPKAQEEIRSGQLSDQTEQLLDTLADGIQAQKSHGKYAAGNFADKLRKAPPNSLTMDAVTQFYISSLLWSDATWYGMLLGGIYKAATKPLVTATGFYAESLGKLAKQDMRMAVRNYRRGNKQWQLYADYQLRLGAAWKLIKMSFELGAPLNTTMRGMSDYTAPKSLADADAAARLAGDAAEGTMALRENTVDNPFFLDPEADYLSGETFNPLAAAVRAVWKANNLSTRIAAAIDTGLSHIVVPAVEYRRFFVEELERAEDIGLGYGTKESADFAVRRAQERLDAISRDVYLNGQTIKNGVLVGTAAENVTNWLNFTDDVWISEKEMREQRTYEGGLREANDRGITDPEEANAFAVDWAQQTPSIPGWSRVPSMLPWLWEKAVNQAPVLRLAQAFNRSPANILKSIMRGTPFAPLVDSYQRDIQSEIPEVRAQANGELVIGSTIAGLLYAMATSGLVQFAGSGPENPDQNRKWRIYHNLTTGPISMRVKNFATGEWHEWVSMQRLDQIGALAGFIGEYIEIGNSLPIEEANKLGGALSVAGALIMRAGKGQFDRTSYQGFKEMIESLQGLMMPLDMEGDRINPAVALVENIAAKLLIPMGGGVRTSRRVIDERRVSVPASDAGVVLGFLQEVFDKTRAQIPGMSSDLPGPLHPVTGAPLMASGIWGTQFIPSNMPWLKALYANITPTSAFPVAPSTNDPVDNELSRLQGKGSTFNFFPPTAVRGYRMTYEEHQEFTRIGTSLVLPGTDVRFHEALRRLITSDEYLSLASTRPSKNQESDQVVRINDEYEKYKQEALIKFLESPVGAKAAETLQQLEQSRIDQRARLAGGGLPSTMPAEGTQTPGVQSWSITPGNR